MYYFIMRNRTFVYQTDKPNVENLKQIESTYHIFGHKDGITYGLIQFSYGKTTKAAEKQIRYPVKISENTLQIIIEIKTMNDIWEKGEPPKRGRTIEPKKSQEMDVICKLLLKQNSELIDMLTRDKELLQESNIELNKTIQQIALNKPQIINNTDNSKKITNINLFLNTECKDAITLSEFVRQIEITDDDLMCLKEHGYVESVSRLLQNALKEYDLYNRPIHCSDIKREILHIKDDEGWKKETPQSESKNIDKAFRHISHKHTRKVSDYYKEISTNSPSFEEKASAIYKIAHASGSEEQKSKKKIIKNLVQSVQVST